MFLRSKLKSKNGQNIKLSVKYKNEINLKSKIISTFVPFFTRSRRVARFVGISVKRSETMMMVGKITKCHNA